MRTLNKWDIEIIKLAKSGENIAIGGIKEIWSHRNDCNIEDIQSICIVEYLLNLLIELNLLKNFSQLVYKASPNQSWRYQKYGENLDYYDLWLCAIINEFMMTEVIKLPGYKNEI